MCNIRQYHIHVALAISLVTLGGALFPPTNVVAQNAPRVILAIPDNADQDVDPNLNKIQIRFDQQMSNKGYSICGGGPSFPQVVGKPQWIDAQTLELQVKLTPEHDYSFSVNCDSAQQCQSRQGVPAIAYPIAFRTRAAGAPPAALLTGDQQRRVWEQLATLINENYSYRDRLGIDWSKHWQATRGEQEQPISASAMARRLAASLQVADDPHLAVKLNSFTLGTLHRAMPVANFNGKTVGKYVKSLVNHQGGIATGVIDNDVGYLLIASWAVGEQNLQPAWDFLSQADRWRAIVIDVRLNGGGDEMMARRVASHFVSEPKIYAQHRFRDSAAPDGFGAWQTRSIEPLSGGKPFAGNVAVLMGPSNMSSNEAFLMMMRQAPRSRLFGEKSLGSSGNPRPYELGHGLIVMIPSWQSANPAGEIIEGRGIEPDVTVTTTPSELTKQDKILEAAIHWLKQK
jgi:hypothetical protein